MKLPVTLPCHLLLVSCLQFSACKLVFPISLHIGQHKMRVLNYNLFILQAAVISEWTLLCLWECTTEIKTRTSERRYNKRTCRAFTAHHVASRHPSYHSGSHSKADFSFVPQALDTRKCSPFLPWKWSGDINQRPQAKYLNAILVFSKS